MNKPECFSVVTKENIQLSMDLFRAENPRKNVTIIYFHGGGLLYGARNDLPEVYINKFLNSGYDFLALDYPLAPESTLDVILSSTFEALYFYLENHDRIFKLRNNKYILFGRSAGAYLTFMMCDRLIKKASIMPAALISFYGYTRLDNVQFNTPSRYYNRLARISSEAIEKIISSAPVTYGPMELRFSLYIKARQDGTWIDRLCGKEDPVNYSLDDEVMKTFPPAILAAATLDPDVPYKFSKTLSRLIPHSHLITIYKEVHDFDREISDTSGPSTYEEIIKWLDEKFAK